LRVVDAVLDWLPNYDNQLAKAQKVGDRMAGWMMLNYQDRRNLDTVINLLMIPYHYYWTRMPSRTLITSLQKPALVNFYYETKRAIALENEQSDMPERLRGRDPFSTGGTLPIPGTNARINAEALLRYIIPFSSYGPNPYVEEDPEAQGVKKWVTTLQKYGVPLGPLTLAAADLIDNGKFDNYYGDFLNSMIPIPGPGMGAPVSSLYQRFTGQMPAKDGTMAKFGFGPDTSDDGFGVDAYRATRALEWIAQEENISQELQGYASQVIMNQYNGDPIDKGIPPQFLKTAMALAERGVKQAAEDRIVGRTTAYNTMMSVQPYTEEERELKRANDRYWASGYSDQNPQGSEALMDAIRDADPSVTRGWIAGKQTPGVDANINSNYKQIETIKAQQAKAESKALAGIDVSEMTPEEMRMIREAAGEEYQARIDVLYKSIDNLKAQQIKGDGGGNDYRSPAEREAERVKELLDYTIFDLPGRPPKDPPAGLEGDALDAWYEERSQWYANQKQYFLNEMTKPITSEAERQGGRKVYSVAEANQIWEERQNQGKTKAEVARTQEYLKEREIYNQYADEYFAIEGYDNKVAWLLKHKDFAELEAERIYRKHGDIVSWADDVGITVNTKGIDAAKKVIAGLDKSKKGSKGIGRIGAETEEVTGEEPKLAEGGEIPSYYEVEEEAQIFWEMQREGADWDAQLDYLREHPEFALYELDRYRKKKGRDPWWYDEIFGEGDGTTSGSSKRKGPRGDGGSNYGEWASFWDEYRGLPDTAAKRQYLLDNPEFAEEYLRYIREQDPEAEAWWLIDRSSNSYGGNRTYYSYGGGGGGGGGSDWPTPGNPPRIDPRTMDRSLWQGPQQGQQWRPYFDASPGWLQSGQELRPDHIRRWERPRF
jgi:hypothetical protein